MPEPIELAPMCFACGKDNPIGLHIDFQFDGNVCTAEFTGTENHVGFQNTVHGGIVAAMLDEVATRAAMVEDPNDFKVTARMTLRYRKNVPTGEPLQIIGRIEREGGRASKAVAELRLPDGSLGAEIEVLMVNYPDPFVEGSELERLGWKVYPD